MGRKVRYGVLSTSRIARNQHVPSAGQTTNSEVVAISSRDKKRARKWAEKLGIPTAYGSYGELLADGDVEAVINPLPNSLHCEWTVKAAEAGKHVLCEKPFAVTAEEARRMISAAEANGVVLMEAFKIRFDPQQALVRKTLDEGAVGEVRIVRAELTYTMDDWADDCRAQRDLAGGALLDAGCYCVNQIRFVMQAEPLAVQAFQRLHPVNQVDSTFVGLMRFAGDRLAFMATGMEQPFRHCCEIIGTAGRIEIPRMFGGDVVKVFRGGEESEHRVEPVNVHAVQLEHFSDCILSGTPPIIPPEDSLRNTAVLAALKQAAVEGKPVAP
jgi:predicted dehydrogenase